VAHSPCEQALSCGSTLFIDFSNRRKIISVLGISSLPTATSSYQHGRKQRAQKCETINGSPFKDDAVTKWHLENSLLLNPAKNEAVVTGTRQQVAIFEITHTIIRFADATVSCSDTIRILSVTIDKFLTFVTNIVESCNYHIQSLRHIRRLIGKDMANTLVCSIVASRLDHCNTLLHGITDNKFETVAMSAKLTSQSCMQCNIQKLVFTVAYSFTLNTCETSSSIQNCHNYIQTATA
jgi:hypothetical protein